MVELQTCIRDKAFQTCDMVTTTFVAFPLFTIIVPEIIPGALKVLNFFF